jgi:hypothetical protein
VIFRLITLRHTQQSVGLLWTRDRPVAETSTWQCKHCKRQTSVPSVGFEPTIPAIARPQTYALARPANGIGLSIYYITQLCSIKTTVFSHMHSRVTVVYKKLHAWLSNSLRLILVILPSTPLSNNLSYTTNFFRPHSWGAHFFISYTCLTQLNHLKM